MSNFVMHVNNNNNKNILPIFGTSAQFVYAAAVNHNKIKRVPAAIVVCLGRRRK